MVNHDDITWLQLRLQLCINFVIEVAAGILEEAVVLGGHDPAVE